MRRTCKVGELENVLIEEQDCKDRKQDRCMIRIPGIRTGKSLRRIDLLQAAMSILQVLGGTRL